MTNTQARTGRRLGGLTRAADRSGRKPATVAAIGSAGALRAGRSSRGSSYGGLRVCEAAHPPCIRFIDIGQHPQWRGYDGDVAAWVCGACRQYANDRAAVHRSTVAAVLRAAAAHVDTHQVWDPGTAIRAVATSPAQRHVAMRAYSAWDWQHVGQGCTSVSSDPDVQVLAVSLRAAAASIEAGDVPCTQ